MLAAAIPQTHIQIPTSYVCSPLPAGHQSVPLRFASHSVPPMFHTFTESSQPLAHSVNFSRQVCSSCYCLYILYFTQVQT